MGRPLLRHGGNQQQIASGIPHSTWNDSNHEQRLDPDNGLLLSVALDAAFDAGLITFRYQDGQIELSPSLNPADADALGIRADARIDGLRSTHRPYLEYHYAEIFKEQRNKLA